MEIKEAVLNLGINDGIKFAQNFLIICQSHSLENGSDVNPFGLFIQADLKQVQLFFEFNPGTACRDYFCSIFTP